MQALWFNEHGTADVLRLGEVPDPVAGPGEVLIRVRAAACNFNDIWARQGLERVHIPLPHISGTEAAGEVVAVGPRVTEWKPGDAVITYPLRTCRRCAACLAGDEVFCRQMLIWGFQTGPYDGAYAQYAKLQAQQLQPKPAHLDWTDAAAISSTLLIAWRMLVTRCQLRGGETVLIWGASGGTGSVAIRLVRLLGGVPIAVTSSDEKAAFCMAQGAEHVLRVDKEDVAARARKLTGGGVDIVFDHVGADVFEASIGIDDRGGPESHAVFRVFVDDKLAFESTGKIRGEPAEALRIALQKAKSLAIEVDFGRNFDLGDYCVFADARVLQQ